MVHIILVVLFFYISEYVTFFESNSLGITNNPRWVKMPLISINHLFCNIHFLHHAYFKTSANPTLFSYRFAFWVKGRKSDGSGYEKKRTVAKQFWGIFLNRGGACGVMVIVVGNEHGDTSSKSWTRLIAFHIALISPWERYESDYSPLQLWVNSRTD